MLRGFSFIIIALIHFTLILAPYGAQAENPGDRLIPSPRLIGQMATDFFGSDLDALFDTSEEACIRACRANDMCTALTFNRKAGACFLKRSIEDRQTYVGAVSYRLTPVEPALLARAEARRTALPMLADHMFDAAHALAERIARERFDTGASVEELTRAIQRARRDGRLTDAADWAEHAILLTDRPDLWRKLALIDQDRRSKRQRDALPAALNAYLRARTLTEEASSLSVLADILEKNGRGRDMIPVLKLALRHADRHDLREKLARAREKYGFRITDHEIDSDLPVPRLCVQFSEELHRDFDYSPYVSLAAQDYALDASGRDLCIEGFSHGAEAEVTFRTGLPAASGELLDSPRTITAYMRDRSPFLRFSGRAFILPRSSNPSIPIETVNSSEIALELYRIDPRNLPHALLQGLLTGTAPRHRIESTELGTRIWHGTGSTQNRLNETVTTRLPVTQMLGDTAPGLFELRAELPNSSDDPVRDQQWFMLTDLGLSTLQGNDGLHVIARSLAEATPRAGVELQLLSEANAVLGTARTDAEGAAHFAPGLLRGQGGAAPALILARHEADLAALPLTDPAFDLSDRGVAGRTAPGPVDIFTALDRGAYRPGEPVHLTALARASGTQALEDLPLVALLFRPDGVEYARQRASTPRAGGHVLRFDLGEEAPHGSWRIALRTDPEGADLGEARFLVSDFLPDRIELDLDLGGAAPLALNQPISATVQARYLFGSPGADLTVEGQLQLRPSTRLADWPGYHFGRHDREPHDMIWAEPGQTDAAGRRTIRFTPPAEPGAGQPWDAKLQIEVAEGSGRPVRRSITRALAMDSPTIGIKPAFDDTLGEGEEARFTLLALSPEGTPMSLTSNWRLTRIETRYQWYRNGGRWHWEAIERRRLVGSGALDLAKTGTTLALPVEWGRYELNLSAAGTPQISSSFAFDAGWYNSEPGKITPDRLDISLDKEHYQPGDTARLRISADAPGTALVSVLGTDVIQRKMHSLPAGETRLALPITEEWGSSAYVTVQMVRPMKGNRDLTPIRAVGLAHAAIAPGPAQIPVTLDAPEIARSNTPVDITLQADPPGDAPIYVTLAAIDQGLLNITNSTDPDPVAHYFGQRRLGVTMRDLYGRLLDSGTGPVGTVRSGGDAAQASAPAVPLPEEAMARFYGPITLDENGTARIRADLPQFNGRVRLMALAWSATGVGQAARDLTLRDPVVLQASLPRFLAPGDRSVLRLEALHTDGPAGQMAFTAHADGITLGTTPPTLTLAAQGKRTLDIPIEAHQAGDASITLALRTPAGIEITKTLRLRVLHPDAAISNALRVQLDPGQSLTLNEAVLAGLIRETASVTVSGGAMARFNPGGALERLAHYPYGCTEQLVSRAWPLLDHAPLAAGLGLGSAAETDTQITDIIQTVLGRQNEAGGFGLWTVGDESLWLDAYVTDFLRRADVKGYPVPQASLRAALANLRSAVGYEGDLHDGGAGLAYGLLVLAREGSARIGDLRYYADAQPEAFETPLGAAQLGAALALYGAQDRAQGMFARARKLLDDTNNHQWRDDFGSPMRDAAGLVTLATQSGVTLPDSPAVLRRLESDKQLSPQEAAWSLRAYGTLTERAEMAQIALDDTPVQGPLLRRFTAPFGPHALTNIGDSTLPLTLTAHGVPRIPPPADGNGYRLTRSLLNQDGSPLADGPIPQGAQLWVRLDVTPFENRMARLILRDPLPAGFEMDRARAPLDNDPAFDNRITPRHAQFDATGYIAAIDRSGTEPFSLIYAVRAISPGEYRHGAATIEDMDRPDRHANSAGGRITIRP